MFIILRLEKEEYINTHVAVAVAVFNKISYLKTKISMYNKKSIIDRLCGKPNWTIIIFF